MRIKSTESSVTHDCFPLLSVLIQRMEFDAFGEEIPSHRWRHWVMQLRTPFWLQWLRMSVWNWTDSQSSDSCSTSPTSESQVSMRSAAYCCTLALVGRKRYWTPHVDKIKSREFSTYLDAYFVIAGPIDAALSDVVNWG